MTKQELERQMLELNADYNKRKAELDAKLFEIQQLEKDRQSHKMKYADTSFYIEIFKYLLELGKTYCVNENHEHNCDECKFALKNHTCIKNWLIYEFSEFTRQAKKELQDD